MNKYLKLFETEDDFKSCLEAKIAGNNAEMGFPNVSVIGEEDSNGNFSASKIHYINGRIKAEAILSKLLNPKNDGHWVNPTTVHVVSNRFDLKTIKILLNSGYDGDITGYRFQPYDWYDENSGETYYAFISPDAYHNITNNHYEQTIDLLDGNVVGYDLLEGPLGYDSDETFFTKYRKSDTSPTYQGKIVYVKDISKEHPVELYEREFEITLDNSNKILTFYNISPIHFNRDVYASHSTTLVDKGIEGYVYSGSGSGSGSGDDNGYYSY